MSLEERDETFGSGQELGRGFAAVRARGDRRQVTRRWTRSRSRARTFLHVLKRIFLEDGKRGRRSNGRNPSRVERTTTGRSRR